VRNPDNLSAEDKADLDNVPGRSCDVGHDGRVPPRKTIQDGRLAGVRRTNDGDPEAVSDALTDSPVTERSLDLRHEYREAFANRRVCLRRDISLIRKIDQHFDER